MDDLQRSLDRCRSEAGARAAALVGRDGLLIETAAGDAAHGADLALAAAEATDLLVVADRLFADALDEGPTDDAWVGTGASSLLVRRLASGTFVLLVMDAGTDPTAARAAIAAVAESIDGALA